MCLSSLRNKWLYNVFTYRSFGINEVYLPYILMKCVCHSCGTNYVYLPFLWIVLLYLPFTVSMINHLESCVMIKIGFYCELPTFLLLKQYSKLLMKQPCFSVSWTTIVNNPKLKNHFVMIKCEILNGVCVCVCVWVVVLASHQHLDHHQRW